MDLDKGAPFTVINDFNQIQLESTRTCLLRPTETLLKSYTGHPIHVLGVAEVEARYGVKEVCLPVHVVVGGGPNLMGRG